MFVFDADKRCSIVVAGDDSALFADLPSDFITGNAYENTVKAGGGIVWSSPLPIGRGHFAVMSRYIKVISTGEPLGVLAVVIDEEQIDRLTNPGVYGPSYASPEEIQHYSVIIDNAGRIISTPFKEDIGRNISAVMRDLRPLAAILHSGGNGGSGGRAVQSSYITEINREETMVTFAAIGSKSSAGGKSGWHLLHLTFVAHYNTGLRVVGLYTLFLSLGFGALAALTAFYVFAPSARTAGGWSGSQE